WRPVVFRELRIVEVDVLLGLGVTKDTAGLLGVDARGAANHQSQRGGVETDGVGVLQIRGWAAATRLDPGLTGKPSRAPKDPRHAREGELGQALLLAPLAGRHQLLDQEDQALVHGRANSPEPTIELVEAEAILTGDRTASEAPWEPAR